MKGFYRGEKLGKTYDLSGIISKRRNELIAAVLHRPYIYSSSDHFMLVLPDLTYAEGVEDSSIPVLMFAPVPKGTDYDSRVLSFCYYQAHKVSEIVEYLEISDSTYFRKQVLGNLLKK